MAGLQKILLAEDNPQLQDIYGSFLKRQGFNVALAIDGEETLQMVVNFRPDLIFLDIMMPKKDGLSVLKLLRRDPRYNAAKTKIVMLTNLGDVTKLSPAVRHDIDGYVIKAEIELHDLLEVIHSLQ